MAWRAAVSRSTVPVAACAAAVLGCGGARTPPTVTEQGASRSAVAAARRPPGQFGSPASLLGSWRVVSDKKDEGAVFTSDGMTVRTACGDELGTWGADFNGGFVGDVFAGCEHGSEKTLVPVWLRSATGFRVEGAERLLISATGEVVARLTPTEEPTPSLAVRARFNERNRRQKAMPTTATPVTASSIRGRWVPLAPASGSKPAFVDFGSKSRRTGSDGCNQTGGRYVVGRDGELLTTRDVQTLIGCENSPIDRWVSQASHAGFQRGELVLFDRRGHVLGRARRD